MKIVNRIVDGSVSAYESEEDFQCPRCKEEDDIKVEEVPKDGLLYKHGIRFMIDCRACWYFGSSDGKHVVR